MTGSNTFDPEQVQQHWHNLKEVWSTGIAEVVPIALPAIRVLSPEYVSQPSAAAPRLRPLRWAIYTDQMRQSPCRVEWTLERVRLP